MGLDLVTLTILGVGIFSISIIRAGIRIMMRNEISFPIGGSMLSAPRQIIRQGLSVKIFGLTIIITGLEIFGIAVLFYVTGQFDYFILGWIFIFITQLIGFMLSTIVHVMQRTIDR